MGVYGYITHSELSHHGILGQKWGKRNGPPYPLDPSAHSAQEKKLTGGRYSQGVKQNRSKGGSSKSSGGKKELTDEERAARKKKVKTALAIGAGATAAAALTAAGIYAAKHPETAKAALSGAKNLAVNAAKNIRSNAKIKGNKKLSEGFKKNALALRKNASDALKAKVKENLKNAKTKDLNSKLQRRADKQTRATNKSINSMLKKQARTERRNERKGIMKDVTSDSAVAKLIQDTRLLDVNRDRIIEANGGGRKGIKAFNDLSQESRVYNANVRNAANAQANYKANSGIRGVAKKVWAPIAGAAGVAGTVGSVAGRINGGINSVRSLANNPTVRNAINNYYYDDYYDNDQSNRKKNKR